MDIMDFKGFVYLLQERLEMFCKTTSAVLIGMSSEMITAAVCLILIW